MECAALADLAYTCAAKRLHARMVDMPLCSARMKSYVAAPMHKMCPRVATTHLHVNCCWLDAVKHRHSVACS